MRVLAITLAECELVPCLGRYCREMQKDGNYAICNASDTCYYLHSSSTDTVIASLRRCGFTSMIQVAPAG